MDHDSTGLAEGMMNIMVTITPENLCVLSCFFNNPGDV